jgi:hypothetical protein
VLKPDTVWIDAAAGNSRLPLFSGAAWADADGGRAPAQAQSSA